MRISICVLHGRHFRQAHSGSMFLKWTLILSPTSALMMGPRFPAQAGASFSVVYVASVYSLNKDCAAVGRITQSSAHGAWGGCDSASEIFSCFLLWRIPRTLFTQYALLCSGRAMLFFSGVQSNNKCLLVLSAVYDTNMNNRILDRQPQPYP